jgi:uncharacterized protein YbaR (Trm112 family)
MPLDHLLVEILVDPEDKQPLYYFADDEILYNPRLRRAYEVRDGIPILLIAEGKPATDEEHDRRSSALGTAVMTGGEPAS